MKPAVITLPLGVRGIPILWLLTGFFCFFYGYGY